jgi:hypothetical protein
MRRVIKNLPPLPKRASVPMPRARRLTGQLPTGRSPDLNVKET